MQKLERLITDFSRLLDRIAGWGIVGTMSLVVVNILLRVIFNRPIQGVYEYVGYLTAVIIGFSLACCGLQKAHIAIGFAMEKLAQPIQKIIESITGLAILVFLAFAGVQVFRYAGRVMASGEVSATAQMPFYPFIYMVAVGLMMLCMIELLKVLKGVFGK